MFNISFMTCIKWYIGHKSLEDQTLSERNRYLAPSHSLTQPLDLGLWLSRSSLIFVCFGQNVTRTKNHVFWQIATRTQSYVIFKFFKICNFCSINEENDSVMYLVFFFFLIFLHKNISGDFIPLTQKQKFPKRYTNLFFEGHFFQGLSQGESRFQG